MKPPCPQDVVYETAEESADPGERPLSVSVWLGGHQTNLPGLRATQGRKQLMLRAGGLPLHPAL